MKTTLRKNHWLVEQNKIANNQPALLLSSGVITYSQYLTNTKKIASWLSAKNIYNRKRVGIIYSYSPKFAEIVNALWFLNAVPVILNYNNSEIEIENQIKEARITEIIIEQNLVNSFKKLSAKRISIPKYLKQENDFKIKKFNLKNEALILFTSGSQGKPKAVVHTFLSMLESCKLLNSFCKLSSNNIWLASLPNYHIGGFMIFVRALISGSKIAFQNNFNVKTISGSLIKYNPTHASLVSTQLKKLINNKVKPNKNLKYLFLGGGPLEVELCKKAIDNKFPIVKVYGSTETCSMISALKTSEFKKQPTSSGKILKGVIVKVKNGRLFIKSKTLFKNYLNQKKRAFSNYFETNDIGRVNKNGYLFIEGRKDDIIISGGEKISAKEIEVEILKFKNIKDAAIFGVNDELWGKKVVAILSTEKNISKEKLKVLLRKKLASYKIPKEFIFVNQIPKNEMGKIDKNKLLKLYRSNVTAT